MNKQKSVKYLGPVVLATLLNSCATSERTPSSTAELSLPQLIEKIKLTAETQKLNLCKSTYDGLNSRLYNLIGDTSFLSVNDIASIDREIRASFAARISLKEMFKDFDGNEECLNSVTDTFTGLRYIEDYLIEQRMNATPNAPAEYTSLKGEFPYLLVNPKYESEFKSYEDVKSGDFILSRGNAYSSAAIARIGTNDYQFSHTSFVYKDPMSPEIYTTEAHIEIGSITLPLIEHIKSKNAREVVFRYSDSDVAHQASKYIYDLVLAKQKTKKLIQYDFAMDYKDESRIFCTEVISSGFKHAMKDADYIPMFKSKFSPGLMPFLNQIGIPATKENISTLDTFAPGDIQFDPRFELVAEWRNPNKMKDNRIKDFILTKIFERMENENYSVDPTFKMSAQSKTLWFLRRLPIVKKFLAAKFPLNMTPSQLQLFMVLDKLGESIYKDIEKASLGYDRAMTPNEIYAVIDTFFKQDFETYKRYKTGKEVKKPNFHLLFHP